MTKTKLKQIAKQTLIDALAVAYYRLEDNDDFYNLSDDEKEVVNNYLDLLATRMCKAIKEKYVTY